MCIVTVTRYACGCDWNKKSRQFNPGPCSQLGIHRVCDDPVKINKYDPRHCGKAAGFRQTQRSSCMGDVIDNALAALAREKSKEGSKLITKKEQLLENKFTMLKTIHTYLWFESNPTAEYKPKWARRTSSPTAPVHSTPGATNVLHLPIITGVNTGTLAHFNAVNSSAVPHGPVSLPTGYMPNAAPMHGGFGGAQQGIVATMEPLEPQPQVLASEQQVRQPLHVSYADAQQGTTATTEYFGPQSQASTGQRQVFQPLAVSYSNAQPGTAATTEDFGPQPQVLASEQQVVQPRDVGNGDAQQETAFTSSINDFFPPGLDDHQDTNCAMEVALEMLSTGPGFGSYDWVGFPDNY